MIVLKNLTKTLKYAGLERTIFENVDLTIPTDRRVALLGVPGSGKSTLIYLLAGIDRPTSGSIERHARLSFPVGYSKPMRPSLSMRQNVIFASRIYDADPAEISAFVETTTGMARAFDIPMKKLPHEVRQTFTYALSYALPFDTYLIDGAIANGSPEFKMTCLAMFEARAKASGVIMSARNSRAAKQCCDSGIVISGRTLQFFDKLEDALDLYESYLDEFSMQREGGVLADQLGLETEEDRVD